jgi:DNA-binding transcriptional LysR family regulator
MELDAQLRAFAAFCRRLSFSSAAEELMISQPAVSKHIAGLERNLGLQLIRREPRGGSLTPAGLFLSQHVLRAEAILSQASRGISEFREPEEGSLIIVASGVPGTYLLPEVMAHFQDTSPGIVIKLEMTTSAAAVDALRSHRAEIGCVGGFVDAPEIDAEPLIEDEIIVVGRRDLAAKTLSAEELQTMTWVSREEGSATRAAVAAAWRDLGISPQRQLDLPSWEAVKLVVASGHGVAACSRFAVEKDLRAGSLFELRLATWNVRRTISLIRIRDAPLTPSAQQFLSLLRERYQTPDLSTGLREARRALETQVSHARPARHRERSQ